MIQVLTKWQPPMVPSVLLSQRCLPRPLSHSVGGETSQHTYIGGTMIPMTRWSKVIVVVTKTLQQTQPKMPLHNGGSNSEMNINVRQNNKPKEYINKTITCTYPTGAAWYYLFVDLLICVPVVVYRCRMCLRIFVNVLYFYDRSSLSCIFYDLRSHVRGQHSLRWHRLQRCLSTLMATYAICVHTLMVDFCELCDLVSWKYVDYVC